MLGCWRGKERTEGEAERGSVVRDTWIWGEGFCATVDDVCAS